MLAGPKPRVLTFLSATSRDEKLSMLSNLGASLVHAGSDVLLLDATEAAAGIAAQWNLQRSASLMDVACQQRALNEVEYRTDKGFGVAALTRTACSSALRIPACDSIQGRRLANVFTMLAKEKDLIVVDGELNIDDGFSLRAMALGEIVVQVSGDAASIKTGYAIIKRLNAQLGKRSFGILVTGTSDHEAQVIFKNMAQAASRYLAVPLESIGSIPRDEHMTRAARAGRSVIDAFPLAGASVAFRSLAGYFAAAERPRNLANSRA